ARMSARVAERVLLENELRAALERDDFVLHYQPKRSIDGGIEGVEALIRWNSPTRGLVSPALFIPLLEETGLIIEVGAWVVQQAVRDFWRWVDLALEPPRIAVNVSAVQLRRADFVSTIAQNRGDTPVGIDIEITESLLMEDVAI